MTSAGNESQWLRRYRPSPDHSVRLVCFPHAGGSASYFLPFANALAPSIEVAAVQYPGRQDRRREPRIEDIGALAEAVFEVLDRVAEEPFAFFGHSLGAVVAFEVARRFQERTGTGPRRLFVSGRRAPSRYRYEDIHLRDDAGIVAELRKMAGTDPRWLEDRELLAAVLPAVRSDYTAIEAYVCPPGAAVGCPVSVLVGDADPNTTLDEAAAWREHATGDFDVRVFPGGHFYLDGCRPRVIQEIRSALTPDPVTGAR